MKIRISALTVFLVLIVNEQAIPSDAPATRTVTDMAGRTVTVPAVVKSVYPTSPMGEVLLYTLAPHKIAGKTWNPGARERQFLLKEYNEKKVLGGWYGKNTKGNPETIIGTRPGVVLFAGCLDVTEVSAAERIEHQLGIPVVMLNGELDSIESAYRLLGTVTGDVLRADTLARYCRALLDTVAAGVAALPDSKKVRVYYADGPDGLLTDPKGSRHTEVIDRAGGINVADAPSVRGNGRITVSIEQLLLWNPQVVLVCSGHDDSAGTASYSNIAASPLWQPVDAVKNRRVYRIPALPFNWFDRPPSVNRIIGIPWLAQLLYPGRCTIDIRSKTPEFYRIFYHRRLTGPELDRILGNAQPH